MVIMERLTDARGWLPMVMCGFVVLLAIRCFVEGWLQKKKGAPSARRHVLLGSVLLVLAPLVFHPIFAVMPAFLAIAFTLLGLETRKNRLRPLVDGVAWSAIALGGLTLAAGYTITIGYGPSMWPAYPQGFSFTVLNTRAYSDHTPRRGDTVQVWVPKTFNGPNFDPDKDWPAGRYHKRIFGLPGDRIGMDENGLMLNGKRVGDCTKHAGAYTLGRWLCNIELPSSNGLVKYQVTWGPEEWLWGLGETIVPKGKVYLLGDNMTESSDSRDRGPVPMDWVVGEHN